MDKWGHVGEDTQRKKKMVICTAVRCYSGETDTRRIVTHQGGIGQTFGDQRLVVISRRSNEQGDILSSGVPDFWGADKLVWLMTHALTRETDRR